MRIRILACGRIREPWQRGAVDEYVRRLSRFASVDMVEVDDEPDSMPEARALREEADRIRNRLRPGERFILLDVDGESFDSERFARRLDRWLVEGGAQVTFVIGSSRGVDAGLRREAAGRLSLSPMTLTHAMARILLLEQCYRAFRILGGERYHK